MQTYGPTMQYNSKTQDCVKCSKCPRLAITHALSLNHHRSIAWSVIVCLSIRRCFSLSTSRMGCWQTHSCSQDSVINKTEVGYVKKPQVEKFLICVTHDEYLWTSKTPYTRCNPLYNRLYNRLYEFNIFDSCNPTSNRSIVYTDLQPVVQPVGRTM